MKASAYHVLRIGMAVTFLWIALLIFQNPLVWGGLLAPWAKNLLFLPLEQVMYATAALDAAIGLLLLVNVGTWLAGLLGSIHLTVILITTGFNSITIRDIGLLAGTLAIMLSSTKR